MTKLDFFSGGYELDWFEPFSPNATVQPLAIIPYRIMSDWKHFQLSTSLEYVIIAQLNVKGFFNTKMEMFGCNSTLESAFLWVAVCLYFLFFSKSGVDFDL